MKLTKKQLKKLENKTVDFFDNFAEILKKNPKKLDKFIENTNIEFAKTHDISVLTGALEVLIRLNGNISKTAKKAKMTRQALYHIFGKKANPTIKNFNALSLSTGTGYTLGFFKAC